MLTFVAATEVPKMSNSQTLERIFESAERTSASDVSRGVAQSLAIWQPDQRLNQRRSAMRVVKKVIAIGTLAVGVSLAGAGVAHAGTTLLGYNVDAPPLG
jgi:hypothetical protein